MVKEAIVEIAGFIYSNSWDIKLLSTVHDELVYKHPIGYTILCPYTKQIVKVADFIKLAMTTVANRYLTGVEMGAEAETKPFWTK